MAHVEVTENKSMPIKISKNALSKDSILLTSLTEFFDNSSNLKIFLNIYNKKSKISLRVLDWFVTNYSKKNNTIYEINKKGKAKNFIVYLEYKAQLRAYSKKQFDPFCRRERIYFYIKDHEILTTIGQLNFFKFSIENKLIDWIENKDNLKKIETAISQDTKSKEKQKKITTSKNNFKITVTFK